MTTQLPGFSADRSLPGPRGSYQLVARLTTSVDPRGTRVTTPVRPGVLPAQRPPIHENGVRPRPPQGGAAPRPKWGNFQKDTCITAGVRQCSAILHDVPSGQSWERACRTTPATIENQFFSGPTRCVNTGLNVWGQFDVSDPTCACPVPLTTKTTCVAVTLWCQDHCGPWEGGGTPISGWYICGGCLFLPPR